MQRALTLQETKLLDFASLSKTLKFKRLAIAKRFFMLKHPQNALNFHQTFSCHRVAEPYAASV
jgi:hypothetical protein